MTRTIVCMSLAVTLVAGLVGTSPRSAHAATQPHGGYRGCSAVGYQHAKCYRPPVKGPFEIPIPNTRSTVEGTNCSPNLNVIIQPISMPAPKGTQAFKVYTNGPMCPLYPTHHERLYEYDPANGTWYQVPAITGPGIYAIVKT